MLEAAWQSGRSALIPVYGRRRVGKTQLLLEFMKSRGGVYVLGKQAPADVQLRDLVEVAGQRLGNPLLARARFEGWHEALSLVVDAWSGDGKLVIVLDEFQWMCDASPELPSVIQGLWDGGWRDDGRVMLLLCGSFVGFMEREVLGSRSPLFGRRTGQIHLQPFGFRDARQFHPSWSTTDAFRVWAVCGGIPHYLRSFEGGRSFPVNLRRVLLDPYGPLFEEPRFLLLEELREVAKYYAVLTALSAGSCSVSEVARATSLPAANLPYYLNQLIELGYVRKRRPLDGRAHSRQVRYTLADPLLRFWFRFVFPQLSAVTELGPERAWSELVAPGIDPWLGGRFEDLCREAMPTLYAEEGVTSPYEVGEYWARDVQIDVVGFRRDGWTDLGECEWGTSGGASAAIRQLQQAASRYPNERGATLGLRVFARRSGPQRLPPSVRWHSLADLYGEA